MPFFSRYFPISHSDETIQLEKQVFRHALFVTLFWIVVTWMIRIVESEFQLDFSNYGIHPLTVQGIWGIFLAPFIHENFTHLSANTVPLGLLMFSLFYFYRKNAYAILFLIYLLSGICVWLTGRPASHIGASGIIYGLASFLFFSGVISSNLSLLTISLLIAITYGGLVWGILPLKQEISWESHLWGGLTGFILALLFHRSAPKPISLSSEQSDEEDDDFEEEYGDLTTENDERGLANQNAEQTNTL